MDSVQLKNEYLRTRLELFDAYQIHPKQCVVSTDGPVKQVHYLKASTGEPLVVLHGGGSHSSEWLNILKPLAEHYTVYLLDAPGFGQNVPFDYHQVDYRQNSIDYLISVLDALGLKSVSFLGNSIGGFYGINVALHSPERITKLILIGAPAGTHRHVPLPLRLMGIRWFNTLLMRTVAKPSMKGTRAFHGQILMVDAGRLSSAYVRHTVCHMNLTQKTLRSLLECVTSPGGWKKKFNITEKLCDLKVPVHVIWGEKDVFETAEKGRKTVSVIPDHTFHLVQSAGHCPWLDQPEQCVKHILSSLADTRHGKVHSAYSISGR